LQILIFHSHRLTLADFLTVVMWARYWCYEICIIWWHGGIMFEKSW